MLSDELHRWLRDRFQVLAFVDLAECSTDVSLIYRLFKQHRKDCFAPNERFVFYTNRVIREKTIKYIRHAADQIDISRCFVRVVCAGHDFIPEDNDVEIQVEQVESSDFDESQLFDTDTICALPWMHLEVINLGTMQPCCHNQTRLARNDSDDFIKNAFYNDPEMIKLRQDLYEGIRSDGCKTCWAREDKGVGSQRQGSNKLYSQEFFTKFIRSPRLKTVSLHPSQVCNFKCRICDDRNSSLWLQENFQYEKNPEKIRKLQQTIVDTKWFDRDEKFMQAVFDLLPDLDQMSLFGGETLFTKQFYSIAERSVAEGCAPNQSLHFNTNGSIFPEDKIPLLSRFKEISISLSIDDIGARFEYQRGGVWRDVESNVIRFLQLDPAIFKVAIYATISNLNLLYLDELLDWAGNLGIPVILGVLQTPDYFRVDQVTAAFRDVAIKKFENHRNPTLAAISTDLKSITPIEPKDWINIIREIDLRRNQCITDDHKTLANLMGYTPTQGKTGIANVVEDVLH